MFHNALYLISSTLIVGAHVFSIQNRVQEPWQSDEALSSAFESALGTYQAKCAEAVAQVIKKTFPDQFPGSREGWQEWKARLEELVLTHRLMSQDVIESSNLSFLNI